MVAAGLPPGRQRCWQHQALTAFLALPLPFPHHHGWMLKSLLVGIYLKVGFLIRSKGLLDTEIHGAKSNRTARKNRWIHFIVGDCNTSLSKMDRFSRQKISSEPNSNTGIIDIYWLLYPSTGDYRFFSNFCGIVTKIDCILTHHNKFNRGEITYLLQTIVELN